MYRLILFCCVLRCAFSMGTEMRHKHQKTPTAPFTRCLLKTGAELSLPTNYTWWYDSQECHFRLLKYPIAIAYAVSKSQVQDLVRCASKHDIKVNPRSGGHSIEQFSSEDDHLVIDLSRMNSVTINDGQLEDGSRTATVGAGVRLGVLYYELGRQQMAFPAGICPTVGLGGQVASAGYGLLSRLWGFAADNVLELKVVTATGKSIVANNETNTDLFFALRGGGGGNYGIVTEMKLKIYPNPPMNTAFSITWNKPIPITDFIKAWFKWKPWDSVPTEMSFAINIGIVYQMLGIYVGEDGHEGLEKILNKSGLLGLEPEGNKKYEYYSSTDLLEVRAWLDNNEVHFGNDSDYEIYNIPPSFYLTPLNLSLFPAWAQIQNDSRVNATHLDDGNIGSKAPIPNMKPHLSDHVYAKYGNLLIYKEFDEAACQTIEKLFRENSGIMLYLFALGGKVGEYPTDFNAYAYRNAFFYMEFVIVQQGETDNQSYMDHQKSISDEFLIAMEPYSNNGSSYQGNVNMFWTTDPKIYMPSYYGVHVDRLVKTKAKYDPDNLFTYRQSTPPRL